MLLLEAENAIRLTELARSTGISHGARGLSSKETDWRAERPLKKSLGMEEKALPSRKMVWSWARLEREGRGPEIWFCWSWSLVREDSLEMELERVPETPFRARLMVSMRPDLQLTPDHWQGSVPDVQEEGRLVSFLAMSSMAWRSPSEVAERVREGKREKKRRQKRRRRERFFLLIVVCVSEREEARE